MRFIVCRPDDSPVIKTYPTLVLKPDGWDDFSFKTMFTATLHPKRGRKVFLESVKIMEAGQRRGRTELPPSFERLEARFCSLGQSASYYELLRSMGRAVYEPLLRGLRDIAYRPRIAARFRDEPAMTESLLRFPSAARALEEGRALFSSTRRRSGALQFEYELPGSGRAMRFQFAEDSELPDRLAVVIGYNGAGKTRLLANLAMLASWGEPVDDEPEGEFRHGRFLGERPRFGSTIAVSYSAFDDFEVPTESHGLALNYTYCGLRRLPRDGDRDSLKSISELTDEFHSARKRALEKARRSSLQAAMAPLLSEPSLRRIVQLPEIDASARTWRKAFGELSTGHKIVLNIIVQLCAHLERRSLVLIDEPELHLHPPLLAALLQGIGAALRHHDSYGIVATHSPVVLQEVPARSVSVLRRTARRVDVERPEIETFGESVGLLTRHAFNLDSSSTDFQRVLRRLAERHSLEEIDEMFAEGLSSQARSLVMTFQRDA